jgi:hypothetical protein
MTAEPNLLSVTNMPNLSSNCDAIIKREFDSMDAEAKRAAKAASEREVLFLMEGVRVRGWGGGGGS